MLVALLQIRSLMLPPLQELASSPSTQLPRFCYPSCSQPVRAPVAAAAAVHPQLQGRSQQDLSTGAIDKTNWTADK
jgi:hypothetical protein